MPLDSAVAAFDALARAQLLDEPRLAEVTRALLPRSSTAETLLEDLVRRGWLTSYQARLVLEGRAAELLQGQYVVLESLGEGGMGQVLKVRHRDLDRIQALKLIRPTLLGSSQAVQRFQRETRAAARLSHPNVVLVHDAGVLEGSGTPFLALEYVEGSDLQQLVRRTGPLPVNRACEFIRQAALGLQHAHDRGLIHRDVKPGNLLLAERGQQIKVVDFGLAFACDAPNEGSGPLTAEGTVVGTPDYMAPEQAIHTRAVDGRADVYSLGCTLYFLLTGRPPFPGGSATQKLLAHQQTQPPNPQQFRPDLPGELVAVLRRTLSKRPEDRYQSPALAAAALTPFCSSEERSLVAPPTVDGADEPTPPLTREEPPPRRRVASKWLLAGGSLAGVLVLVVVLLLNKRGDKADENGPHDPNNLKRDFVEPGKSLPGLPSEVVAVFGTGRWHHWGQVTCLASSPDGKTLASGGQDKVIRLWDVPSGGETPHDRLLSGHGAAVTALAFSRDGRLLASASLDATVRLWNVATGQPLLRLDGGMAVRAVAFDGNKLLAAAGADKRVHLWDVSRDGKSARARTSLAGHAAEIMAVTFSPDGKSLASGDRGGAILRWPLDGSGMPKALPKRQGAVNCLSYCPRQGLLAAGGDDNRVELLDAAGVVQRRWAEHTGAVMALAFSPDGATLVTASLDADVKLWNARTQEVRSLATLQGHFGPVLALAFPSGSGRTLVSGGEDGAVRRWDLVTGKQMPRAPGHTAPVQAVAFSPDGKLLASGGVDQSVRLWEVPSGRDKSLRGHEDVVRALAFSPDRRTLASGGWDGRVFLWPVTRKPEKPVRLERGNARVHTVAFAPDGRTLAVGGAGSALELWEVSTRKKTVLPGHKQNVWAAAFAAEGRLATGDGDWNVNGRVRIWRWRTGTEERCLLGHEKEIRAVAFAPNGKAVASAGNDGKVRLWDLAAKSDTALICAEPQEQLTALAYAPNGATLVSADFTGQVTIWDAHTGKKKRGWKFPGPVNGLAFSPDGRRLALANFNGTLYLLRPTGR